MPSMLPLLSYSVPSSQDDNYSISQGSTENSPKALSDDGDRMEKRRVKSVENGSRSASSAKEGKKSGKKKRRPAAGKVGSRKEGPPSNAHGTGEQVEKVVQMATAHAKAVQLVKKAVWRIQLCLLDGIKDKAQLQGAMPVLTQDEYSDVVTERSIVKQCGYPLCQNALIGENVRKGRYRISLREHKVYDMRESGFFCSASCHVASKTFQSSLHIERDGFMGKEKLIAVVRSVHERESSNLHHSDENAKGLEDHSVLSNKSVLAEVQERLEVEISSFDDSGPFDAIEGYVPQNSIKHWGLNKIAHQSGDASMDQLSQEADLERIASGNEPALSLVPGKDVSVAKGKSLLIFDEPAKVELSAVPLLKSALKKGKTDSIMKRSVSWGDLMKKDRKSDRKDQKLSPRLKERPRDRTHVEQAATPSTITRSSTSVISSVEPADIAKGKSNPALPLTDSETQKSERVLAAEAVATALIEAAEASVGGEIGSAEAVASAGLSIISVDESVEESLSVILPNNGISLGGLDEVSASSGASSAEVDVRWPLLEPPEDDDLDFTTARGSWHDAPPRNFKVEVSMFGTLWMALEEWISAATIAHIYGKESQDQDEYVVANGREFRRQVSVQDGASAAILGTFSTCISRAFPDVVQALRLNVPVSTLEQTMGRLVRTMTFVEPLPPFGVKNWQMVLLLLLDGLSVQRLPIIGVHLANNMALLRKLLDSTGISEAEYDAFRGLLLPLGRLPTFATMSGG